MLAVILLVAAVAALFPYCRYYVDPDATAYLTIAKRYAAGDYAKAINGYWSPLSCWLTAFFIKCGYEPITAAIIVNAAAGIGWLFITNSFFQKFKIERNIIPWLNLSLVAFLSYAIYAQSFADLWECFLLLGCLRILISSNFKDKPVLWILYGVGGTLAYFAKAYSFPFFILNTIVCGHFIANDDKKLWLKISVVSISVMIAGALPWIYLLHGKYGIWTTSTAGSLNMSWYLAGHPYFKEGVHALLPPPYTNSPYYWEDPYIINGSLPHAWDSLALFKRQILRLGYNVFLLFKSMSLLSFLFIPVWYFTILTVFSKRLRDHFPGAIKIVAISFLLFPLGFLPINYEPRYIWYMLPLGMLLGALVLRYLFPAQNRSRRQVIILVFCLSFALYPVADLQLITQGKAEHDMAVELKTMGITGSFASNSGRQLAYQRDERLAYFAGITYYPCVQRGGPMPAELIPEMKRYGVRYYFYHYGDLEVYNSEIPDSIMKYYTEISNDQIRGLKIFEDKR